MRLPIISTRRWRRASALWNRLPLRLRLVAGFAAAMLLVLSGAGAFVYLRVQYALDLRLNEDLSAQSAQLVNSVRSGAAPAVPAGTVYQLLDADDRVISASPGLTGEPLLRPAELATALHRPLRENRGDLFPIDSRALRLHAVALHPAAAPPAGTAAVAVVAVRRDQRDEALRELIGQLTLANLAALAVASYVGYRLARAALVPVERYRTEADRIAAGATGVRLAVPTDSHDEVARLGHTLNTMLTALETALDRERRFVNDASHELRTPLTLLATELELTLRAAAADTGDLIRLADTLLDVGVQPAHSHADELDLDHPLTDLVTRYRAASRLTDATLRTDIDAQLRVRADATRLEQVVTNLLDNAVRHGTPPITLTADRTDTVIRLNRARPRSRHGSRLPAPRHRTVQPRRHRPHHPGTGLGLSLVDAIVTAHRGELRICSRNAHHRTTERFNVHCTHPTAGATLTVLLPAADHREQHPLTA